MRKISFISVIGLFLAISVSNAEGPYLILSPSAENSCIIDNIFRTHDEDYTWVTDYNGNYAAQINNLDDFGTVFLNQYWGYCPVAMWNALYDYCSEGGKVIVMQGTNNDVNGWTTGMGNFVDGRYQYVYPGGWELTLPDHVLAEGLPDQQNVYQYLTYMQWIIDDDDAEVIGVHTGDIPAFTLKQIEGRGEFMYLGFYAYEGSWNAYPNDLDLLEQIVYNAINYIRGSKLYGQVINATSRQPVEGALVSLYDSDLDSLLSVDTTDVSGNYECSVYLLEDMLYHVVYSKELYVSQTIEDLEGIPPDDIEQNINLIPFLETDIEDLQTEVPLNTWVDVTGIVTIPTNTIDTEHLSIYIQDHTPYGIHVYGIDPWDAETNGELNRGDEVRFVGRLAVYDDITEITDIYLWEVLSTGNPLPDPLTMPTGTMANMQEMEGSWAHIVGYLQDNPAGMGSYTIRLDDGSGECAVRIIDETGINLVQWSEDDWLMVNGIIGLFEGSVQIIPALEEDVFRTPMYVPRYPIETALDMETGVVEFVWDHYSFGPIEDLVYDDGDPSTSYQWPGNTMCTHMSLAGPCQILAMQFYISTEDTTEFNAEIYLWDEDTGQPEMVVFEEWNIQVEPYEGWYELVIADLDVEVEGDFVVGFGSVSNRVEIGGAQSDNGRSWDYTEGQWSHWTNTYYIRCAVQYANGNVDFLDPWQRNNDELDAWQNFNVYRNGEFVQSVQQTRFTETVPAENEVFSYTISTVYHEGETDQSLPLEVIWSTDGTRERSYDGIPTEWSIAAAYPNPFNPIVNIVVAVPQVSNVHAEVFDMLGRTVAVLDPGRLQPGYHNLSWSATGPSGIYFLKVSAPGWSEIRKLVYMK